MSCCDSPGLLAIERAVQAMCERATPVSEIETLPLGEALGRVLAEAIASPMDVPPFTNSAMDGYACRFADLTSPALTVIGTALAGQPFTQECTPGSAVRIMTGAPLPKGADVVVMQENVTVTQQGIIINSLPRSVGANIRPVGDDITQGALVLPAGHRLTPRDVPMLASLGIAEVKVRRKPKVAILSTGDELKPLGSPLEHGEIYDSNRYTMIALLNNFGCDVLDMGIVADELDTLKEAFTYADNNADLVISSGGVSVGEADYTKTVLEELGKVEFWKIAIKPGKPFAFGQLNHALFCGLPGNPVSAFVTLYVLVQPLLANLSGHSQWQPPLSMPATLLSPLKKAPGRCDYQRGYARLEQGKWVVETTGNQSSGAFRSMSLANCFIVLERERGHVAAGESVNIEWFSPQLY
ncbi:MULTISPECIES: molybdopterin molybdotransferase MoeA [unclassified Vibrio]|uniref:Molybdopterin molybdenumtransferase n=1 Tax=Vibrio sp. HB236076 TaxID=3232307 RepID=A0AB39HHQ9_9VIBR|nr:molybdopterin molybdotransferase MoeA [Vibrio sp. HB161653]MDP5253219.1 molybdopterin molybdotransferase MoeA [Vibrio sp. HB161653]